MSDTDVPGVWRWVAPGMEEVRGADTTGVWDGVAKQTKEGRGVFSLGVLAILAKQADILWAKVGESELESCWEDSTKISKNINYVSNNKISKLSKSY